MKLEKLIIHNIASFEDIEIDFDQQPLVDSDVFLITGNTGAGKSTILDAICLALYATTPRLKGTKMQGAADSVQINDPRQLMRKNTGEAFVSLTFVGNNKVHYKATWEVHRAGKKPTGALQAKKWRLENLDNPQAVYEREGEIKAEINSAIGLDFNQFCRTTMFAQGEFTRFLNSEDDEKAKILEKITGVDVYSKIGAKIFEETSRKKNEWGVAQGLVEGVKTLSQEEIDDQEKELKGNSELRTALQKEQEDITAKCQWIADENTLSRKLETATSNYKTALDVLKGEDFKDNELLVKDWNATIEARSKLSGLKTAEQQRHSQEEELGKLTTEYKELLGGQQYANGELKKLEGEQSEVDTYIRCKESKKGVYENAQTIVGYLAAIADGRNDIACNKKDEKDKEDNLNKVLLPAKEQADQRAKMAECELGKMEADLKKQEEEFTKMDLPTVRKEYKAANTLLSKITLAKRDLETISNVKAAIQRRREQNDRLKKQIEKNLKDSGALEPQIHDKELIKDTCKKDLDKQRDTVDKFAQTLRAKLKKGDICPVCGQAIAAELPHEEALSALVNELQEDFNKAKNKYDKLVADKNKLDAQITTDSRRYNLELKAIDEDTSVAEAEEKALSACKACGIDELDESALISLESKTNATITTLEGKTHSGELQEKAVKEIREKVEELRKMKVTADEVLTKANKAFDDCKGEITTCQRLIEAKNKEVTKAEAEVETRLNGIVWDIDWHQHPEYFGTALTTEAVEYNLKVTEQAKLENRIKDKKKEINDVNNVLKAILAAMPEWSGITHQTASKIEGLLDKTNKLTQTITTIKATLKTAEETILDVQKWFNDFLMNNPGMNKQRIDDLSAHSSQEIDRVKSDLEKAKHDEVAQKTKLKVAQKNYDDHNGKKPALGDNDTLEALEDQFKTKDKQINELIKRDGAIQQILTDDATNKAKLGKLIEDANCKKALYEKWDRLNQLIGDAQGSKFRKIAQSYVLTNLIHSANSYMATLTDRYILKVAPGTFVISVEDAYQGFASRAASTISGGESFLVSLSLALALSDIGQNLSVDTIFIDEGFGTLSGEPLQNAIETLRSLHTKAGRHVGIISHVEELQEKIPVQIQARQDNKASSSVIHIVPELSNCSKLIL